MVQLSVLAITGLALFVELPKYGWFAAWLVCLTWARVITYEAYVDPSPVRVQKSVGGLIKLFIPLDALACAASAGWLAGGLTLSLLVPTYVATRRTPMT